MASLVLSGDTSGTVTVSAPAVAGSNTQTLVAETGTLAPIVSGTAVSASGTEVDFTGIPSWVKRITVMFSGVSTNGTSVPIIQIGDSGGIEDASYVSSASILTTAVITASYTSGFGVSQQHSATDALHGCFVLNLLGSNQWAMLGHIAYGAGRTGTAASAGTKTLSDTLTQVRITTVGGTNTFDAGTINILYE